MSKENARGTQDDLISRQAALDALRTCYDTETVTMDNGDEYINYGDAVGEIEQLPPAQPEQHIDEWCTDCKEYDKEKHSCPRWNRVIRQTLADAQPERTGHWIPVGMAEAVGGESAQWGSAIAYHKCSECDEQALCEFGQEVLSKWCPHCGAKMEGVSNESN